MKAVASERERIRQRERDRLAKSEKVSLRRRRTVVSTVVDDFNITKMAGPGGCAREAGDGGYRRPRGPTRHLPVRPCGPPIALFLARSLYRLRDLAYGIQSIPLKIGILRRARLSRTAGCTMRSLKNADRQAATSQIKNGRVPDCLSTWAS